MTTSITTLALCGGTVKQRFDTFKVFSSRSAPPIHRGFPATFEVVGHDPLPLLHRVSFCRPAHIGSSLR